MIDFRRMLDRLRQTRVLVVGDLMADKYVWAEPLSEPAKAPIVKAGREEYALGGAANVAHNLADLGVEVYLCGVVGYDDAAHWFRRGCNEAGIETSGILPVNDRPTTLKVRVMTEGAPSAMFRIDYEVTAPPSEVETASMRTFIEHYLPLVDAVVLSDYDKGIFGHIAFAREILDKAEALGKFTVVESKAHLYGECRGARLVILSDDQAEAFYLRAVGSVSMEWGETGARLRELLGCGLLAVVRNDRELWIHYREGESDGYKVLSLNQNKIRDTTGVKDTITGALTAAFVSGATIEQAARLAILAGEAVVQKVGTVTVKLDELQQLL